MCYICDKNCKTMLDFILKVLSYAFVIFMALGVLSFAFLGFSYIMYECGFKWFGKFVPDDDGYPPMFGG